MSLDEFNAAVRPKVLGTLNLHRALKDQPLDFFLMTSSIVGVIGTVMQSNYAAGSSFLDHMARHRENLGLPGTSIALGMITGAGFVEGRSGT